MTERLIRTATDWADVFRLRIAFLGLSHLEVDKRADLPLGYTNKIVNGKKRPGAVMIERYCRVLGMAFQPVVDTAGHVEPMQTAHFRTLLR
jgi:hypothetical protein